jgi:alanine-glyoxylate transaminase/(R)-3-amino-2-methylpropionate-pyruvate transaminase
LTPGLFLYYRGLYGNTLRIKPPMCITKDDADFLAECLDEVLGLVSQSR